MGKGNRNRAKRREKPKSKSRNDESETQYEAAPSPAEAPHLYDAESLRRYNALQSSGALPTEQSERRQQESNRRWIRWSGGSGWKIWVKVVDPRWLEEEVNLVDRSITGL